MSYDDDFEDDDCDDEGLPRAKKDRVYREVEVDVIETKTENEIGFIIKATDGSPLDPQEILDAISDVLIQMYEHFPIPTNRGMDS